MHPWLLYGETLQLGTYPVAIVVGFAVATVVLRREARVSELPVREVMDATLVGLLTGAVGARAFHVLIEAPALYWADPLAAISPFAGWTYYGGLLGGLFGIATYARWRGLNTWRVLDLFALAIPAAQVVARLGCLGAGCCHGRRADWPFGVQVPWAVTYDQHGHLSPELLAVPLHPAPLYLSLFALLLFVGLTRLKRRGLPDGLLTAGLLIGYGSGRAVFDSFRGDRARGLWLGDSLSTAQLVGLVVVVVGLFLWRQRRRAARSHPA